jgi:hypothetical protein
MSWRSGFFRLWVVVSGIWAVTTVAFLGWEIIQPFPPWDIHVPNADILEFPMNTPRPAMKGAIIDYLKEQEAKEPSEQRKLDDSIDWGPSADKLMEGYRPRGRTGPIVEMLEVAVSLPAILLILGLSFGWVIRGFRRPSTPI